MSSFTHRLNPCEARVASGGPAGLTRAIVLLRQHSIRRGVHQRRWARQAVIAAHDKDKSWPRRSEPDAPRQDFSQDTSSTFDDLRFSSFWSTRFDRLKETFFFRLATLGFGAVLVGERVSGGGFVQALGQPKGVPLYELDLGIALVVLCLLVGGLVPSRFIYKSINNKPESIFDDIPALAGRVSCIGLAITIATEAITGKGILGQLNVPTGVETLSATEFAIVFVALFFVTNIQSLTSDKN